MTSETIERSPAEIESRIEEKRADLGRKLEQLEHRLSPREQIQRMKSRIHPEPYIGWAALGAVATGVYLAVRGWRRAHRSPNGAARLDINQPDINQPDIDQMDLEEVIQLDCGSPTD